MSKRMILVVSCASFFGLGWLAGALGPALDELAAQTNSSLSAVGAIFLVSFIGGLPAQGVVGAVSDRFGQRWLLIFGAMILATMDMGLVLSHRLELMIFFAAASGLGFAALDVGYNILIAEVFAGQVNAMNALHVFFGVGAVASPAFAGLTLEQSDTALTGIWVGAGLLLALLPIVYRFPRGVIKRETGLEAADESASFGKFSYATPLLWVLGGVMLLYVGIEMGLGNWTPAYLENSTEVRASTAALALSGFWLALSGSRIIMAIIGNRFTPKQVMWVSVVGSLAGGVLLAASTGNATISIIALLICGFFFGPVYPTVMLLVTGTFRSGPGKAASVAAMLGGIGGGTLSWAQGILLDNVSPAASVIFTAIGAGIMLLLWLIAAPNVSGKKRKPKEAHHQPSEEPTLAR